MWRPELKKSYLSVAASNILSCINIMLCMFATYILKCASRAPKLGNKFKKWVQWVFWFAGSQHWFVGVLGRGWGPSVGCVTEKRSLQRRVRWRGELCFVGDGCSGMYRGPVCPFPTCIAGQNQINASIMLTLPHISEGTASPDLTDTCSFFNLAFQDN